MRVLERVLPFRDRVFFHPGTIGILFFFLLTLSANALAAPAVGDEAVFDVSPETGSSSSERLQVVAFDAASGKVSIQSSQSANGDFSNATSQVLSDVDAKKVLAYSQISNMVSGCARDAGSAQSITVPAGSFQACKIPINTTGASGFIWIAHVPFGIVKSDLTIQGNRTIRTLKSYQFGR